MSAVLNNCDEKSPFRLENDCAYREWRERKLGLREAVPARQVFTLDPRYAFDDDLRARLGRQIDAHGFVLFEPTGGNLDSRDFIALNRRFGLHRLDANPGAGEDSVTALQVVQAPDPRAQYIPYTNRAMNWHTDGYYNPAERRVNAFALYCVHPASRGGDNYLFDHEMMYLRVRDESPELLHALMQDDLMCVPANVQGNRIIRAEESGPVFSMLPLSCALNMRYTSRPHNIVWKNDARSRRALDLVREILVSGCALVELRLRAGQGLVCNNLLHGRQAFQDDPVGPARLVYRARYHDVIDLDRGRQAEGLH